MGALRSGDRRAGVDPVGVQHPIGGLLQQLGEQPVEARLELRAAHRDHHLDPASQIAGTPVGGADQVLIGPAVSEMEDPLVLQEAA